MSKPTVITGTGGGGAHVKQRRTNGVKGMARKNRELVSALDKRPEPLPGVD